MRRVALHTVALLVVATSCSRSDDDARDREGRPASHASLAASSYVGPHAPPPTAPPQFDAGGDDDDVSGSPTRDLDRRVFDAVRRDRPRDLDALTSRPLRGGRFDSLRSNLLASSVTFHHATSTEAGREVVYTMSKIPHEIHLIYESRGTTKLADAYVFGW